MYISYELYHNDELILLDSNFNKILPYINKFNYYDKELSYNVKINTTKIFYYSFNNEEYLLVFTLNKN